MTKIYVDKCSKIVKVGEPIVHHTSGSATGTWMRTWAAGPREDLVHGWS